MFLATSPINTAPIKYLTSPNVRDNVKNYKHILSLSYGSLSMFLLLLNLSIKYVFGAVTNKELLNIHTINAAAKEG